MFEEIKTFSMEQIETRAAEIKAEIDNADAEKLEQLNAELSALETRKGEIEMETRKENMKAVAEGAGKVIAAAPEKEERTLESVKSSQEYLEAFANYIKTGSDKECRALLTDLGGGSVPTPTVIDNFINTAWDRIKKAATRKIYQIK
jgi:HK97 family phage major capsid protein